MHFDWSDGSYEDTARQLALAADHVVARAGIAAGERVLDVGCGTGNAALAAARRGARVTGIDPAERLLEVARRRATGEGLEVVFARGEAAAPGVPDGSFDAAVAMFSIIFAPSPEAAVAGVARALRPGGRLAVTAWVPEGAIHDCVRLLEEATRGEAPAPPLSPWAAEASLRELFAPHCRAVSISEETLPFIAPSARAWYDSQETLHPFWRAVRASFADRPGEYAHLRERLIDVLERGNENPGGFHVTSGYRLLRATIR